MKISFLSVTIAVSIGLGLGYGAYQAKNRVADFLNRPRFAVVNLNSVVKAMKFVSSPKANEEEKSWRKPSASLKDSKKNLPR